MSEHHEWLRAVEKNISQAILGKSEVIRLALVALLAEGHLLIEDAPGVGKTSLAKAIAHTLGCKFTRLQCTPDMLPGDILGTSVFLPNKGEFEFFFFFSARAALHEPPPDRRNQPHHAAEPRVAPGSDDGAADLDRRPDLQAPRPFMVLATQNPLEFEGTYPLPENQLDRFMLCLEVGYPDRGGGEERPHQPSAWGAVPTNCTRS